MKVMLGSYSKVRRIMRELRKILSSVPDENVLLYSYWINEGVMASLLCRNNSVSSAGIRVVCRGHGWDVYAERHPESYLPWRKFIMMNADAVFCISRHGKDYLKKNFPDTEEVRLRLSCLGVPSVPAVREYPDFDADVLRIVSCSLMLPVKRIELLIKSLSFIDEIQTEWVHIGGGERFGMVSDMAAALLSGKKNITYQLKGQLTPLLRDQILGSGRYSVFINTSGSEGLPVSMMEAASCGLPIIATAVGGVPEIVRDEWNGFLLAPDPEPREIAAALQKFFKLEKSRKMEMSVASRAMWSENFNAAFNYPRFGEEISRLLS